MVITYTLTSPTYKQPHAHTRRRMHTLTPGDTRAHSSSRIVSTRFFLWESVPAGKPLHMNPKNTNTFNYTPADTKASASKGTKPYNRTHILLTFIDTLLSKAASENEAPGILDLGFAVK